MQKPITLTADNFQEEVINSSIPVLVDFWAQWCPPCRMLAPTLDRLAQDIGDSGKVGKIDIDKYPDLATQYGVMSVPTLIALKDGKIIAKAVGVRPLPELKKMLGV